MRFMDERAARDAIARLAATSDRCHLAVAFWGRGAADRLELAGRAVAPRIICNLRMGGTNPDEIERLMADGADVRQADDLHAKVYLFDHAVIIGSSNASSNGLSFQEGDGTGWREANVLIEDATIVDEVAAWFDALACVEITPRDLVLARSLWNRRRLLARPAATQTSLLEMLRTRPAYFADRSTWLVVSSTVRSDEAEALVERIQREESRDIDAYEDFPELPIEGQLVALQIGPRGGVAFDGYWDRTPQLRDRPLSDGLLNLLLRRDDIAGLVCEPMDRRAWRDIVVRLRRSPFWDAETGCAAVSLKDVADLVAESPFESPGDRLARRFDAAMRERYRRIVTEARYPATDLRRMLEKDKGLPVARRLLAGGVKSGFTELWERGFSELTVEALVLEGEWRSLFTAEELATAERRLERR